MRYSDNFKRLSSLLILLGAISLSACTGAIQEPVDTETDEISEANTPRDPAEVSRGERSGSSEAQGPSDAPGPETAVSTPNDRVEERIDERPDTAEEVIEETAEEVADEPTSEPLSELDREALEPSSDERVSLLEPPVVEPLNRARRRLNLDQLSMAISQVSGGLMWSERVNNQERDLFVTLSDTLGKPDYIQSTTEDLTPSALFLKFLDDAARQVCEKRIDLDLSALNDPRVEPAPDSVKLWGNLSLDADMRESPVEVEAQIRALVLRFHSRQLPEGDSPRLAYWRWLFETATLVDGEPLSGWRALCVTLINHPDFYSY